MARFCVLAGLMLAQLVLSSCSSRQQVDLTQWRDYRDTTAKELSRPLKTSAKPSQVGSLQAKVSRATDAHAVAESVGTVGRAAGTSDGPKHLRPWPKRGTPEFEQLQAEEIEQENRARAATRSICRGC
jgi:hypothetical protein